MTGPELDTQMMVVLGLLAFTVYLFVSEVVRIDLAAILVMVLLGALSVLPGLGGLADLRHLFDGFASNAVISIIAVMIIGAGLDRTGVMTQVARVIARLGGGTEQRLVPIISGTVGVISSFMQNVGATALFLPVVSRIAGRTGIPISRLLMPMGFCAILGGTMTMVGSSPLILLNDLILGVNASLPAERQMQTFELFDVTPIGLVLVACGIAYFSLAGRWLLSRDEGEDNSTQNALDYFRRMYSLNPEIHEVVVRTTSPLIGRDISDLLTDYSINVIGIHFRGRTRMEPAADIEIEAPARLAVIAHRSKLEKFLAEGGLFVDPTGSTFSEELASDKSGIAEIVIPPDSDVIGKTLREIKIRKNYGLSVLALFRQGVCYSRAPTAASGDGDDMVHDIGGMPLESGDTLVCHTSWTSLLHLQRREGRDFIVATSDFPQEEFRPDKTRFALIFFLIAIGLVLFTDIRLSLCLLIGATGMVLTNVIALDDAYNAISWKTVFLLASLIPLGQAVQNTGTAEWIAVHVVGAVGGLPTIALQTAIAVLATVFTLVMSNVGATVLLVPLAVNIALAADADPALFALTVAISTSNSFLIPTHQVNALIMGPGGYRVVDFVRAGGIMTLLFLVVSITTLNLIY